jgi:CheY-like chemotaxis protein
MPTVLLVDDSPVVLHALAVRLRAEGVDVREESTAAGARRTDVASLCCAVVDLDLSDGDGAALAAVLRAEHASLPIAFFTAGAEPPLLERAREQGPVFAKPNVEAIAMWVRQILQNPQKLKGPQPPPTK